MRATALLCLLVLPAALISAGCQSTQDKAAKLAASSSEAFDKQGLRITKENADVEVVSATTVSDPNGTAVAVRLRNTSDQVLVGVPVAIDARDEQGKSLFRNDAVGLETSLVGVPLIRPREELVWVHDQVVAAEPPVKATAKVGPQREVLKTEEPRLTLQQIEQTSDAEGTVVTGYVANKSEIDQRNVVIYGVATDGDKVVAAGRGQVQRVRPGKRAKFNVFFIGDPTGAKLDLAVPVTTLR